ncbi:uncharacterized protein JN550_013547 [Neoarthrinium moseri]|uniref:uncharacterized protein n=1 Tax=Neoarthrinium moseri TaxID=1658444 RepID=UPI001FDE67C3|nr:uncharacterized protein JN550_013547 [Neoarthrinium moseri]KAI1856945.1 hypothetical protein JN550_013547 [Neoarthrinium moseri]
MVQFTFMNSDARLYEEKEARSTGKMPRRTTQHLSNPASATSMATNTLTHLQGPTQKNRHICLSPNNSADLLFLEKSYAENQALDPAEMMAGIAPAATFLARSQDQAHMSQAVQSGENHANTLSMAGVDDNNASKLLDCDVNAAVEQTDDEFAGSSVADSHSEIGAHAASALASRHIHHQLRSQPQYLEARSGTPSANNVHTPTQAAVNPNPIRTASPWISQLSKISNVPCFKGEIHSHSHNSGHSHLRSPKSEINLSACSSCGFHAKRLFHLTENVFRSNPDGIVPWDAVLKDDAVLSKDEKEALMFQISLWMLRDYAASMLFSSTDKIVHEPPTTARRHYTRNFRASSRMEDDNIDIGDTSFISDLDTDHPVDLELSGDESVNSVARGSTRRSMRQGRRGRPRKAWTDSDEQLLRLHIQENHSWSEIGHELNRTPNAVEQHWKIMFQRDKINRKSPARRR